MPIWRYIASSLLMLSTNVDNLPAFLLNGSFYESLDKEEQLCEIQVPDNCYVETDVVNNVTDFAKMIQVVAFWGLHRIPLSMILFCDKTPHVIWSGVIDETANLGFARALLSIFEPEASLDMALMVGFTEIVEYLAQKCSDDCIPAFVAAQLGRLDYLKILHQYGHPWDATVSDAAAAYGHLDCLQYLRENGCPWISDLYLSATASGHLNCIQYAFKNGLEYPENFPAHVASCGQLAILTFIVKNGGILDSSCAYSAAKNGHAQCLAYLLEVDCPVGLNCSEAAAENGHVESLKLIFQHTRNQYWNTKTIGAAAINGHLQCLQYLHENDCPWDERTTNSAAGKAHFECLRYAIDHHCPYEPNILTRCIHNVEPSSAVCLKYLSTVLEHLWLPVAIDGSLLKIAFSWGNHYTLYFLISREHPYLSCALTEAELENVSFVVTMFEDTVQEYDANLLKCIECFVSNQWDINTNGVGLQSFLLAHTAELPLSVAYIS